MFNWLKPSGKRKVQDRPKTLDHQFLQDSAIRQQMHRLQMLVGITREDFQALYVSTMERYVDNLSIVALPTDRSVFIGLLENVIFALKKRRGYLLPLGADSETSFREREEWTFAVFSAALLKQFDSKTCIDFAKIVLPSLGFSWLKRNEALFDLWQGYLNGEDKENIFTEIVSTKLAYADDHKNDLTIQDSNELENDMKVVAETIQPLLADKLQDGSTLLKFNSYDFWSWLKEGIVTQTLAYNQIDSTVHGVELGLFICMPQTVEHCFSEQVKKHNLDINTVTLAQRIELTKAIKKHEGLVRNAQGSRTHVYCRGQWQDRQLLSGLVMQTEALFAADFRVPINPNLAIDPMTNI